MSFQDSTELRENVKGGTPLRELSPLATPHLNMRENDTHVGAASGIGVSIEEVDEEDSSDDSTLLGLQRSNNLLSCDAVRKTRVTWASLKNVFRLGSRGQPQIPPPVAPRCECHPAPRRRSNKARNRLLIASALTLVFMIAEIIGAYGGWVGGALYTMHLLMFGLTINLPIHHGALHKFQWNAIHESIFMCSLHSDLYAMQMCVCVMVCAT